MKNNFLIVLCCLLTVLAKGQNSTFSPYSRYGLGELAPTALSHNLGMGGAGIALKPDSTMPIFLNTTNPASYALNKLTSLEIGGTYRYSSFKSSAGGLQKWGTNFSYGVLGFPIRENGGACIGIMPYSHVGYDTQSTSDVSGIGTLQNKYSGTGGLNKAFIGYGIMPFHKDLRRFRYRRLNIPDSTKTLSHRKYLRREFAHKMLSDFSIGFNAMYIFGNIQNSSRIIFPNSLLYNNTYNEQVLIMGDFTGNFGAQTAITFDSVNDQKGRHKRIEDAIAALIKEGIYNGQVLEQKKDSIRKATPLHKRALRDKVKFTFGYFMGLNNPLKVNYNTAAFNYILNGFGQEIIRDTSYYTQDQKGSVHLPLEQGFGLGFKKGERINLLADAALTNWQNFKFLNEVNTLKNNYRLALGCNFVPEKYAAGRGAFWRRVNYRVGVSYQTGYINLNNTLLSNYSVSAGLGLPVGIGRLSSMVNVSAQYGVMGTQAKGLTQENYWRINFGFTFCDRWFEKFRYN